MFVYLDERCLSAYSVERALVEWKRVLDFRDEATRDVTIYLDAQVVRSGLFLGKFNALTTGKRQLYRPLLFGGGTVCWRPGCSLGQQCSVSSEPLPVVDCALCEAYEVKNGASHVIVLGDVNSTYAARTSVLITDLPLRASTRSIDCGADLLAFQRVVELWGCGLSSYNFGSTVPPTDFETALFKDVGRFVRTTKVSRNGRRRLFLEVATSRLFYVDNLHYGYAAHLEVFDQHGEHLGTADLEGTLDPSRRVPGRFIDY
jgi:hypothetical protein